MMASEVVVLSQGIARCIYPVDVLLYISKWVMFIQWKDVVAYINHSRMTDVLRPAIPLQRFVLWRSRAQHAHRKCDVRLVELY